MTILQALKGYYDRVAEREPGGIAAPGYSDEKISFAIVIDKNGKPVRRPNDLRDTSGKKPQAVLMPVPASFKRPGVTPRSFFLWDKTAFVFGVTRGQNETQPFAPSPNQHDAFRQLHLEKLADVDDEGLVALRKFVESWFPAEFSQFDYASEMADTNVVFRLDGEQGYIHDRPAARELWTTIRSSVGADSGLCLVTGETAPIARLHPAIKNIPGQTTGGSIVSFNLDAFTSYGFEQGLNAPVSEAAAFGYTTALNRLLRSDSRNRIQLADATTVFWAEAADAEEAEAAENAFAWMTAPPNDASENVKIRTVLELVKNGRPLHDPTIKIAKDTKFYILGLAPNAARLSIRYWEQTTLGRIGSAFHQHWRDIKIDGRTWVQGPSLVRLILELLPAHERKGKSASKLMENTRLRQIAGEIMRAILTEQPYPRSLFAQIVSRIRADGQVGPLRAAILKACLIRNKEAISVSLDRETKNPGYRLGRLFAVLEAAQRAGVGKVVAGVREKFMGSASAAPANVFPVLLRNYENHLASAKKKGRVGRAIRLDKEYAEIVSELGVPFPALLRSEDQGQFFVAFHLQQADLFKPKEKGETISTDDKDEAEAQDAIEEQD